MSHQQHLSNIEQRNALYKYSLQMSKEYNYFEPDEQLYRLQLHYVEDVSWLLRQIANLEQCLECACSNFELEQELRVELEKKLKEREKCS